MQHGYHLDVSREQPNHVMKCEKCEMHQAFSFFCFLLSLGDLTKVRIWHDNKFLSANWYLENVEIVDKSTDEKFIFPCNRWLAKDKDDGSLVRELTCANPKKSADSRTPTCKSRVVLMSLCHVKGCINLY